VQGGNILPVPATFKASFDARRVRSLEQMKANLASKAEQVVDARAADRFEGRAAEPRPGLRGGHIPGSRNLPYGGLIDPATGVMKPLDELRAAFSAAGIDLQKPVATSCGSGVSAAVLTLALYRLGIENPALYDGSWSEWGLPDGPPAATGKE
jgi:thiosulfate/3-mercaptopyruvate sulfurtransferase